MVALVSGASSGIRGRMGAILSNRPFVGRGRISYGIYLYHIAVAAAVIKVVRSLFGTELSLTFGAFSLHSAATVAIACASWLLLARPALSLKNRFRRADASSGGTTLASQQA